VDTPALYRDGETYRIGEPSFPDINKLLYRLPELLADPETDVWIVEGETCADVLVECGVLATTSDSASSATIDRVPRQDLVG
jgi:hypothetical protein